MTDLLTTPTTPTHRASLISNAMHRLPKRLTLKISKQKFAIRIEKNMVGICINCRAHNVLTASSSGAAAEFSFNIQCRCVQKWCRKKCIELEGCIFFIDSPDKGTSSIPAYIWAQDKQQSPDRSRHLPGIVTRHISARRANESAKYCPRVSSLNSAIKSA